MEHAFSIEMKSKKHVKHISLSNESHEHVLFEGSLGELEELSMIEGAVLEVRGANGVLRIDLSEEELRKMLSQKKG
ncbi:MAG: hypothetical protein JSV15_00200 [Candidatus Bathyarchaeota archaeon]|nr:MAG: hypothetical protein JSV15_00200 [Candidatus Bathyarchaeota archaeon]